MDNLDIGIQRTADSVILTMPNGGTVNLPSDVTEAEIDQIINEIFNDPRDVMLQSPKAGTPQGDFPWSTENVLGAFVEPIIQMGGALGAEAKAGLLDAIPAFIAGEDARAPVEQTRQKWAEAFAPKTSGGKIASQALAETVNEYLGPEGLDVIGKGPEMGQQSFERTGSPFLAAAQETLPTFLESVTGVRALTGGPIRLKYADGMPTPELVKLLAEKGVDYNALTQVAKDSIPEFAPSQTLRSTEAGKPDVSAKRIIGKDIKAGGTQEALARYEPSTIFGSTKDKLAMDAINLDVREGIVQLIKQADPTTKLNMIRIIDQHKTKVLDEKSAADPYAVIGNALESRVNYLDRQAGNNVLRLNNIVNKKFKGVGVDATPISQMFIRELDSLGIKYKVNEYGSPMFVNSKGKADLDFSTSKIAEDPASQRMINKATQLVANRATPDAASMHLLKQQLDGLIDWNKASTLGAIPPTGANFIKQLRHTANGILRDIDADYARINDDLSMIYDAKGALYDSLVASARELAQKGEDWGAAGNDLRKLYTNYGAGYKQTNALKGIDEAVSRLQSRSTSKDVVPYDPDIGVSSATAPSKANLYDLGALIVELDRVIQPTKSANFQSKISAGNENIVRQLKTMGQGPIEELYGIATRKFRKDDKLAERQRKFNTWSALDALVRGRGGK